MAVETEQHLRYALDAGTVCSAVLRRRAETSPDAILLLFGEKRWTYRETWLQSVAFQRFLFRRSSRAGHASGRVAIFLENRPETVFAWFGAQLAGCPSVLINRGHRGPLLEYQLRQSLADVLVTDSDGLQIIREATEAVMTHTVLCDKSSETSTPGEFELSFWSAISSASGPEQGHESADVSAPGDLCSLLFTSGTTGRSKAVRIPHRMIVRGAARLADAFGLQSTDIFHGWLPLYHVGGLLHTLMSMVVCGGAVALIPKFSLSRFWEEVRTHQCTIFAGFGSTMNLLWHAPATDYDSHSTLRIGLSAMCPPDILRAFEKRFDVLLLDSYGMTEVEPLSLPPGPLPLPPGSCGKPNPDFGVSVHDEQGRPVSTGEVGEIVVRPRLPHIMMQGYENDPAATVLAWQNLWMHTGDLGRIDSDGYLYVAGRIKDVIRRRGENISAWEVENVLTSHPSIRDCAAVGIQMGMGEEELKIVIVPATGSELTYAEIRLICHEFLSTFMIPRYIEIRESLPLNHMGKVDKDELRKMTAHTVDVASMDPA